MSLIVGRGGPSPEVSCNGQMTVSITNQIVADLKLKVLCFSQPSSADR